MKDKFEVNSNVNVSGKPFVSGHVSMNGKSVAWQWTPSEARAHAFQVLQAAEAAEHDSYVLKWLRERVKIDNDEALASMLNDLRKLRDRAMNS